MFCKFEWCNKDGSCGHGALYGILEVQNWISSFKSAGSEDLPSIYYNMARILHILPFSI